MFGTGWSQMYLKKLQTDSVKAVYGTGFIKDPRQMWRCENYAVVH